MDSTTQPFFDELYARSADPWGFATEPYEQNRHRHIVEQLGAETFERGFEPGCSIGELTQRLATRCRHLLALDISPIAVARARARCAGLPQVQIAQGRLPEDLPTRGVDLLVLSEIGYYFERACLADILDALTTRTVPGALLVVAHWTGVSADHLLSGYEVHEVIDAHAGWTCRHHEERPGYVIGTWRCR